MTQVFRHAGRLVLVAVFAAGLAGCGINSIPTKQEAAKARWADVQNNYQRRADLIPNLVATVKGYATQERTVLDEVTQARASATQIRLDPSTPPSSQADLDRYAQAQDRLGGALSRLLVANERYPELKSNENFLALQSQLEGTENRISIARRDYNLAVQDYNTTLRVVPTSFWAATLYSSSKPMPLFTATAAAQSAPTVSFDTSAPGAAPGSPPPSPAPAPAPAQQ
ncbi:MAG TPA: LemA family protein [Caulobacteraceae bacterium]